MNISSETVAEFFATHGINPILAPDLLAHLRADEKHRGQDQKDTRNIHDYLKRLSTDEVREDLVKTRSGFVPVFFNVVGDFNLSSGIRSHNWFNGETVWLAGKRKWDRRGAVGAHHYVDLKHTDDIFGLIDQYRADGYTVVAAEITDDSTPLHTFDWPDKVVCIFGEESAGVSEDVLSRVDTVIHIPARGSVRSLNVASCATTFMYDYASKRGYLNE